MATQKEISEQTDSTPSRRKVLGGAALALAAVGGLSGVRPAEAKDKKRAIEGAWLETTNAGGKLLYTYGAGGVVNASTGTDQVTNRMYSPTYGVWEHVAQDTFEYHVVSFYLANDGTLQGIFRAKSTMTLSSDENQYTGAGEWQIDSLDGTPGGIFPPTPYTQTAERITV